MDIEAFKVLLEAQERTLRSAMDIVVKQQHERIQLVEGTVTDLIKSLEFSQAEIKDLKNEMKILRNSTNEKQVIIEELQSKVNALEHRINYQEDYSRRNNLRISGIQEQAGGETWEQTASKVSKLLEDKLQLPSVNLERAHRVGPSTTSHPRAIVVRFEKFSDREATMRNAKKLKGTGVYINEDLCPASMEIKKNQFPLMKQAKSDGKIAFFRHTRLIIREKNGHQTSSNAGTGRPSGSGSSTSNNVTQQPATTVPEDGSTLQAAKPVSASPARQGSTQVLNVGSLLPSLGGDVQASAAASSAVVVATPGKSSADVKATSGTGAGGSGGAPDGATAVSRGTKDGASASPSVGGATKKPLRESKRRNK